MFFGIALRHLVELGSRRVELARRQQHAGQHPVGPRRGRIVLDGSAEHRLGTAQVLLRAVDLRRQHQQLGSVRLRRQTGLDTGAGLRSPVL